MCCNHRTRTQQRYAGSEPTKITEAEELEEARKRKDEGAIMAVQSGLFKLLIPLPRLSESSMAKKMTPNPADNTVMFLLHPRQPLSVIAVSGDGIGDPKERGQGKAPAIYGG